MAGISRSTLVRPATSSRLRAAAVASLGLLAMLPHAEAFADGATPVEGSGPDCVVRGKGIVEKGVQIFSSKDGGVAIAGFATQEVTVELADFPADPLIGRAKIKTGKGSGSVRIEGWVDPTKIPLSTRTDAAVVEGHVWIGKGEPVRLRGALPGKLSVESTVTASQQKLRAKATCSAFAVGRSAGGDHETPATAKRWVLRERTLDLFDDAGGAVVFTLEVPSAESGLLLWSTEQRGPFVHVQHGGQIIVDAWAKASELKAFPKGEMLDELAGGSLVSMTPAKLKVDGSIKELKVSKEVPLRLAANESAKAIGALEEGAEVVVIDTVAGWARVFPKGLEIIPPDGKDFWAKSADLGL
jgi:hypothetical protein